jgi:hypothetical protein
VKGKPQASPLATKGVNRSFLLEPDWILTEEAKHVSGMSKSRLWQLWQEGQIKSFSDKAHPSNKHGKRYWSKSSLLEYLDRKARLAGVK